MKTNGSWGDAEKVETPQNSTLTISPASAQGAEALRRRRDDDLHWCTLCNYRPATN